MKEMGSKTHEINPNPTPERAKGRGERKKEKKIGPNDTVVSFWYR